MRRRARLLFDDSFALSDDDGYRNYDLADDDDDGDHPLSPLLRRRRSSEILLETGAVVRKN